MNWLAQQNYQVLETLWEGAESQLQLIRAEDREYLLEIRPAPGPDEAWKQWVSYCHHPDLLLPVGYHHTSSQCLIVYPAKNAIMTWPTYVQQVFGEYMAEEELCLELAYRLCLVGSALLGKGLRPVSLKALTPERIVLTGDGEPRVMPPEFDPAAEPGPGPLLRGLAQVLFAALTHPHTPADPGDKLARCRDLNREISLDAQTLVRRLLPAEKDRFESLGAVIRWLTQLHIRRSPQSPYRDSGPLRAFRPEAPERDYKPELEQAVESLPGSPPTSTLQAVSRLRFFQDVRNLRYAFLLIYLLMLSPAMFARPWQSALLPMALVSCVYWMMVISLVYGYRRRNTQ